MRPKPVDRTRRSCLASTLFTSTSQKIALCSASVESNSWRIKQTATRSVLLPLRIREISQNVHGSRGCGHRLLFDPCSGSGSPGFENQTANSRDTELIDRSLIQRVALDAVNPAGHPLQHDLFTICYEESSFRGAIAITRMLAHRGF